jgi:hypothetical protein
VNDSVNKRLQQRKERIQKDPQDNPCMDDVLHYLLPPGSLQRLTPYEEEFAKLQLESRTAAYHEPQYLCDIQHHKGRGPVGGSVFPVALASNELYYMNGRRLILPSEILTSQGVDMFDELSANRSRSELFEHFAGLKGFAGKCMDIPTFTVSMFYVMANLVPIADFYKIPPQLAAEGDE